MNRNLMLVLVLISAHIMLTPISTQATLIPLGEAFEIGSWSQRFEETGVGTYDTLEFFMMSAASDFEAPGVTNFSASGWTGHLINPDYALASGPDVTWSQFDLLFTSAIDTPLVFNFLAWDGGVFGTLREHVQATWNGSSWSFDTITTTDPKDYNRAAVPLPGALLLLGVGLARLAAYTRRRSRA